MFTGIRQAASKPGYFAAAAAAASILLLFPFLMEMVGGNQGIIGVTDADPSVKGDGDPYQNAWHFWWVSRALVSGNDPRYCPLIYAPEGASIILDHVGWFDTILFGFSGLGQHDAPLSHNLSLMMGTVLTALFGWLLARSWGAGRYGALLAALAMAWLPGRTAHMLQHYQVASIWTLPASLWAAENYSRRGGWGWLAAFGAAALAGGMESPFHSVFIAALLPILWFVGRTDARRTLMLGVSWVVASSLVGIFIFTSPGESASLSPDWREAIYWSAEPQSFLMPSPFGPAAVLFGLSPKSSWMPNAAEGVVTPGITVLAMFLVFIAKRKDWRMLISVLVLCMLALGPQLRILGRPLGIPLPFRILQHLPLLGGIRAPSRFALPAGILMALGAGMAFSRLGNTLKCGIFAMLTMELMIPALPVLSPEIPGECLDIPATATVLELPVDNHVRRYSWFQTGSGYSRRYSFLARLPELTDCDSLLHDALTSGNTVIYHRWLLEDDRRSEMDSLFKEVFPQGEPDDSIWVRIGYQ